MSFSSPSPESLIGICGGVGPHASLLLQEYILQHTTHQGRDQGHVNILHGSCPHWITDRTSFLTHPSCENPAKGMAKVFAMLLAASRAANTKLVVGVPCNTFHAPPIWDDFMKRTSSFLVEKDECVVLHMVEETVGFLRQTIPCGTAIGLLTTSGTREVNVFPPLLVQHGYPICLVSEDTQKTLDALIYDEEMGLKSTLPRVHPRVLDGFSRCAQELVSNGARAIILGCTEIPFGFQRKTHWKHIPLINPMIALARALVKAVEPKKLSSMKMHQAKWRVVEEGRMQEAISKEKEKGEEKEKEKEKEKREQQNNGQEIGKNKENTDTESSGLSIENLIAKPCDSLRTVDMRGTVDMRRTVAA